MQLLRGSPAEQNNWHGTGKGRQIMRLYVNCWGGAHVKQKHKRFSASGFIPLVADCRQSLSLDYSVEVFLFAFAFQAFLFRCFKGDKKNSS